MFPIHAESKDDLIKALRKGIPTTPRGCEQRGDRSREKWAMVELLKVLNLDGRFQYPMSICHRDECNPPDFRILSGTHNVGVEHTECASSKGAEQDVIDNKHGTEHGPRFIDPESGTSGIGGKYELPSMGDDDYQVWEREIFSAICKKIEKFPSYEKFDENWLLIHENWLGLGSLDPKEASRIIERKLPDLPENPYDRIFIIHNSGDGSNYIFELHAVTGACVARHVRSNGIQSGN